MTANTAIECTISFEAVRQKLRALLEHFRILYLNPDMKYGFPVSIMLKSARDSLQRLIQASETLAQQLERLGSTFNFLRNSAGHMTPGLIAARPIDL
jgi:hypothetical protein